MEVDEAGFYDRLLDYSSILYLCHRNADPDAIGSAFALAESIGGTIGITDGINRVAGMMIDQLGIETVLDPNPADYDFTVVVDTSTIVQINNVALGKYCVIDHHATTPLVYDAEFYLHRTVSSTAEIIFDILSAMEAPIMKRTALALLMGIITDTGHFRHASASTFNTVSQLLDVSGVDFSEVLDMLSNIPQDPSMRIAMLKSASRATIVKAGNWIIVYSKVGSFGGSAASSLINLGADVTLIGSDCDDTLRITGRARKSAIDAGINLGKILEHMGAKYSGSGGGHAGAAGMDVKGNVDVILNACVDRVKSILEPKG